MKRTFKTTAVLSGDHYQHFGIHPITANLYGNRVDEIVNLTMVISNDQTVPVHDTSMVADYWGYYDYDDKRFSLIYPKHFLLNMCFPNGIKACEDAGQGKAYRLEIKK